MTRELVLLVYPLQCVAAIHSFRNWSTTKNSIIRIVATGMCEIIVNKEIITSSLYVHMVFPLMMMRRMNFSDIGKTYYPTSINNICNKKDVDFVCLLCKTV